ncbi:MAG: putative motility protein [Geothrix sp.]|uniref:Motility protein n=1 Tax=Candidatus Geothrix odensensis TaxID=2954440 RepID=A0A936F2F9_9BACT|nr:putative motility protein [Holophagaceae bacterium]MBK8571907.1 putative motility protein [Candidatus Geothrix odensensis]MBK8791199.1 putative motility protein [Holophagaceae bacterium]MBP7617280.1 putative motility protein [Geothrix sp.]
MEISPAGAAAQAQQLLQQQVAVGVLRKSLDIEAQQGAALVKMLNQSTGLGQGIDQYA